MILLLLHLMSFAKSEEPHLLYFILVDRFENGRTDNDDYVNTAEVDAFHGGDLVGISNRIDHLTELGVDWVWISPIFEFRKEKYMGHAAFHGYWTNNLDRVEPHVGTEKDLVDLQTKLKSKNISLVLDMVYNHVAMDSLFTRIHPDWFHKPKEIKDWNNIDDLTTGSVHGLPDLNQSRESLYFYFLHRTKHWLKKTNAAGIRIDALKHMKTDFIKRLRQDLRKSHPDVNLLGEDFDGNPITLSKRANETLTDAIFDFPMHYSMTDVFCKNIGVTRLAVTLSMDELYPENLKLVTFLDNHDLPRIDSVCPSNVEVSNALLFQFGIRGLPMISYGFEAGLKGLKEPHNRGDMVWNDYNDRIKNIRALRDLREKYPVLVKGNGQIEELEKDWLVYSQKKDSKTSVLVVNQSNKARRPNNYNQSIVGWTSAGLKPQEDLIVEADSVSLFIVDNTEEKNREQYHTVRFEISGSTEQPIVVGSTAAFGHWNPQSGLKLEKKGNKWIGEASVKKGAAIAWKLVTMNEKSILWEPGENRILWNQKEVRETIRK